MIKLLSKNILIYGTTNALKSLIPFIMLPILTSHLSISDYGLLSIIETTILFITPFILLNINSAINIEYFKVEQNTLKKYITNAILLSIISFLFLLTLALSFKKKISNWLNINENLIISIIIFSSLRVIPSVVLSLYQSKQLAFKFLIYNLFQSFMDFSLSYLFVVIYKYGYMGRLAGTYISFLISTIIGVYIIYKMNYLTKPVFYYSKDILKFCLPLIPHSIGGTIIAMSDRYFVLYFFGNEKVGLYTIAYQLSAIMLLVSTSVNQAWAPMFFKLLKEKKLKDIYTFTTMLFIFFILIGVIIYLLKDLLFSFFVNIKYYKSKEYFLWLLLGFIFQSLYFLVTNLIFFEKKTKILAFITMMGAFLNIILNYILIKLFGVIGVAYATAITWLLFFISILIFDIKIIKDEY
jgi:O-antigen/teichoic acid export membrane protein